MVAKGYSNKVIADVLNLSCSTVCSHLRRVFAKLGVGFRAAMVTQAAGFRSAGIGVAHSVYSAMEQEGSSVILRLARVHMRCS
jgi:Bacterial regulatory proteins, luxR family